MVTILEVNKIGDEYTSSLSKSFATELEQRLLNCKKNSFVLITDGIHLQAFDGSYVDEIYQIYDDGQQLSDLSTLLDFDISELPKRSTYSDITTTQSYSHVLARGAAGPTSYKTLKVKGVSQGKHPWCWAATCAALINYYKGTSLTASKVANYVFPKNPEQGGTWPDIKKAYNHWKLYPSQTGVISFSNVKSNINSRKPMHLGLKGHSVGLIGYEDWVGAINSNDRILILLEPNGGVIKSVSLKSSGNFTYKLGGGANAWQYTRRF
ncbi:MAG: papain-like cysteine protease family protein [Lachnospiraceae bacterium]|nr:papain-like cysteine protease family protein [Lachnospiraceae bacterium]